MHYISGKERRKNLGSHFPLDVGLGVVVIFREGFAFSHHQVEWMGLFLLIPSDKFIFKPKLGQRSGGEEGNVFLSKSCVGERRERRVAMRTRSVIMMIPPVRP